MRLVERLTSESKQTLSYLCRLEKNGERRKKLLREAMSERLGDGFAVSMSEIYLEDICSLLSSQFNNNDLDREAALRVERVRQLITELMNFCYGENDVEALRSILDFATANGSLRRGGDFVDIGCGRGKMLAVACLLFTADDDNDEFGRCRGVDIVDERIMQGRMLIEQATRTLDNEADSQQQQSSIEQRKKTKKMNKIEMIVADITDDRTAANLLRNASLVYMYSTCFSHSLHEAIVRGLVRYLRKGARVVLHGIHDSAWQAVVNNTQSSSRENKFKLLRTAPNNEITFTRVDFLEKIV